MSALSPFALHPRPLGGSIFKIRLSPHLGLLRALVGELGRAAAAAQRYEELRRMDATGLARLGLTPAGIPRHVFEEFFSGPTE